MRLPDPKRSCAVLIGVSAYHSRDLPDLPAVANNIDALAAALTDRRWGGFVRENCATVADSGVVRGTYRVLREYAARAQDTFVVYYAGHGLTGPARNELYLALADTELDELQVSALSFDLIRDLFLECPATNRVLILDCCFSGRAAVGFMGAARETLLGQVEIAGTYTLASAPPNAVSLAPVGAKYTAFTGELIKVFQNGIPGGPELLNLGTVYQHLLRVLTAQGLPRPGQRGTDSADLLALTRNPATAPIPHYPVPVQQIRRPGRSRRPILGASIAVAAIAGAVGLWIALDRGETTGAPNNGSSISQLPSTPSGTPPTSATVTTTSTSSTPVGLPGAQPVRVYNNSNIRGLSEDAAEDFRNNGWTVLEVDNYPNGVVATSTAYFRPGTEEEPEAKKLAAQFGLRAEPRFEGIKDTAPGIIVIITREYKPKSG